MNKNAFLEALRARLSHLPKREINEFIGFYGEMIDDRIESGLTEEAAIDDIGALDDILAEISSQQNSVRPKKKRGRVGVGTVLLLALGSPLWLSILISAFAVLLSLLASLWSVIISLWAVFASLVGGAVGGLFGGIVISVTGSAPAGIALIGAALVAAGLSVFSFLGCMAATKGSIALSKLTVKSSIGLFARKKGNEG